VARPEECKLFKKECTPVNPIGACMVSKEGTCNIAYRYGSL
jgi:hydrogenase expression/formation protein HypD